MVAKKELQEKVLLYQLLHKYADGLREQIDFLNKQLIDVMTSQQAIEEIKAMENSQDMLVSLGAGCWSNVKLQKEKQLLVNLGAGVLARQSLEQAERILNSRIEEIKKEIERVQSEFLAIEERLVILAEEIEKDVK